MGLARSWARLRNFTFTFHFNELEKEMATHSSVLVWRIPGTGEPGGMPSMGLHRVRHDWSDLAVAAGLVMEKKMATHSSTLAWRIPWMEEPGRLYSRGLLRVGHDWATSLSLSFFLQILGKQYFEFAVFLLIVNSKKVITFYRGDKTLRNDIKNKCSLIIKGPPLIYFALRIIHWHTFLFQLMIFCCAVC